MLEENNNCDLCPYNICGRIPPQTTFKSDIVIVGMSPGNDELKQQKPFVGRSGKLLRETLLQAGFDQTPYITNALLCKPLNEKNVSKEAIKLCRPRVIEEIKQCSPKFILALGNVAITSIQNDTKLKISSIHGTPIPWTEDNSVQVIPIFHPAKVLRNTGDYHTFLNGFLYAKQLYDGYDKKDPGKTILQFLHNKALVETVTKILINHKGIISCDIETTSLNPKKAKILCVGFGITKNYVYIFPSELLPYIKEILENCSAKIVYQRGQFDTSVLNEKEIKAKVDHDTLLLHYCLNENEGNHDLQTLAQRFLGAEPYWEGIDKSKLSELPKDILYKECAKDADYTLQLLNIFLPIVEQDPNLNKLYYQILIPGINFLRRMSQNGFMVNLPYLKEYKIKVKNELDILEKQVIDNLGIFYDRQTYMSETKAKSAPQVLNIRSDDQMRWLLFDKLKIKPKIVKYTDTGKKSIEASVLESIEPKPEGIKLLLAYNKLDKIYTTYIIGIESKIDDDQRLRSSFSLQTTVTGRLSSSKPNIQNIPRDNKVKNIFCAPRGRLLIEADYKALELRLLAHFSKDPYLIKAFNENRDIHNEVSFEIFGKDFTKEQRVAVKGVVFGSVYGRTAFSIAEEFNISVRDAQKILNGWLNKIPIAMEYMKEQERHLLSKEPFITPFGRYRRYGVITGDQSQKNEARNFIIQSSGSDLNLISAMNMEEPLVKHDTFSVNIVHDSVENECPNNRPIVENVIDIINNTMMQTPRDWLSPEIEFPVEIKIGHSWGDMKEINIETKEIVQQ
jgi:DNA polymerase-1